MDRGNAVLQVRNLRTEFATRRGIVPAVDGVSFEVFEGKVTGLVGELVRQKASRPFDPAGPAPGASGEGGDPFEGRDLARMTPREMGAPGRDLP